MSRYFLKSLGMAAFLSLLLTFNASCKKKSSSSDSSAPPAVGGANGVSGNNETCMESSALALAVEQLPPIYAEKLLPTKPTVSDTKVGDQVNLIVQFDYQLPNIDVGKTSKENYVPDYGHYEICGANNICISGNSATMEDEVHIPSNWQGFGGQSKVILTIKASVCAVAQRRLSASECSSEVKTSNYSFVRNPSSELDELLAKIQENRRARAALGQELDRDAQVLLRAVGNETPTSGTDQTFLLAATNIHANYHNMAATLSADGYLDMAGAVVQQVMDTVKAVPQAAGLADSTAGACVTEGTANSVANSIISTNTVTVTSTDVQSGSATTTTVVLNTTETQVLTSVLTNTVTTELGAKMDSVLIRYQDKCLTPNSAMGSVSFLACDVPSSAASQDVQRFSITDFPGSDFAVIKSKISGACLQYQTTPTARFSLVQCPDSTNSADFPEALRFQKTEGSQAGFIKLKQGTRCADVMTDDSLVLRDCSDAAVSQQFYVDSSDQELATTKICKANTDSTLQACLQVYDSTNTDVSIIQGPVTDTANALTAANGSHALQIFSLIPYYEASGVAGDRYYILQTSETTKRCVQSNGLLGDCSTGVAFEFKGSGDQVALKSIDGKCLSISTGNTVSLLSCTDTSSYILTLTSLSAGANATDSTSSSSSSWESMFIGSKTAQAGTALVGIAAVGAIIWARAAKARYTVAKVQNLINNDKGDFSKGRTRMGVALKSNTYGMLTGWFKEKPGVEAIGDRHTRAQGAGVKTGGSKHLSGARTGAIMSAGLIVLTATIGGLMMGGVIGVTGDNTTSTTLNLASDGNPYAMFQNQVGDVQKRLNLLLTQYDQLVTQVSALQK